MSEHPVHPANPLASKSSAWSGRFDEPVADFVLRYTASVGFDRRLAFADIQGSLAHAAMLARAAIISAADLADIERGLAQIRAEIEQGRFEWRLELEDVHLNIEKRLTDLVGDAGKRLHTGRSRNDQVATDLRLWLRGELDEILALLKRVQGALVEQAARHAATVMPGFTHLQVAQPVTFGHHLLAYVEMFERDHERFVDARRRLNRLPLGAAALAGTTFPIDRVYVAEQLGFVAAQIAERMSPRVGVALLIPMLAIGIASVIYWRATERAGAGNVLPYAILQAYTMAAVLLLAFTHPSRYTRGSDIYWVFAAYLAAKVTETFDAEIWQWTAGIISGHTLKHVFAALSGVIVCFTLLRRRPRVKRAPA